MREFTHEERLVAASAVAAQTVGAHLLRPETHRLVAEAWAQGEVVHVVSNQFAIQLQCELTEARKIEKNPPIVARFTPGDAAELQKMKRIDQGVLNATLDILALPLRPATRSTEVIVFTPDEIQAALAKNLARGLRQLAEAIEAGMIEGKCLDCKGHGFGPKHDDRAHVMLRIDLTAAIRQTFLEGESREEFERDRMGQTGEDNARKMFGEKEKPEQDELRDSICREMFECDYERLSDTTKRLLVNRRFDEIKEKN